MNHVPDISAISDDDLLKLRFCDLGLAIKGTCLEECVAELYRELDGRGIAFKPACYLADEWLTPDPEPVVGIAFYLAHPRLRELENRMMHEVEGGDRDSCLRLLRHETGHALNYAYRLHTRKRWKQLFGRFSAEYPDRYKYHPYSKSFVRHLDDWYAQYHPDEDFAETFAVWLAPGSDWRERYRGWKALDKLEYVDALMREIAGRPPRRAAGRRYWNIASLKTTLKSHYRRKTEFYAEHSPDFHDAHLARIFAPEASGNRPAHRLMAAYRKDILDSVAYWTGERKYIIEHLLRDLSRRCRELRLSAGNGDTLALMKLTAYITSLMMNYIYAGRYKREK